MPNKKSFAETNTLTMLEGYEPVDVGWLSVLPPLIAMVIALLTKEVIVSLLIGILFAATVYVIKAHKPAITVIEIMFSTLISRLSANMDICIFLLLMGALVHIIAKAGGTRAFGDWSQKVIHNRKVAITCASLLGSCLFLDDYFNIITTSAVMKIVLEKNHVSKPKIAYIIHTMASNICILVPISSWAAVITSQIEDCGISQAFSVFLRSIPLNLYSLCSFVFLAFTTFFHVDYGAMHKYETIALQEESFGIMKEEEGETKGKVIDLVLPIIILVSSAVLFMVYIGGGFSGKKSIQEIFADTDTGLALLYASFTALVATFLLFLPRKLITFTDFIESLKEGIKSMIDALLVLVLAWTISGVSGTLLRTGEYIGHLIASSPLPLWIVPSVIFVVGGLLTFSMGTTWASFGILIPIVITICKQTDISMLVPCLSACLCGSVFGDNVSPICDNTILVSSTTDCDFLVHVKTEASYAVTMAFLSIAGYIITGLTKGNVLATLIITFGMELLLCVVLWILKKARIVRENAKSQRHLLEDSISDDLTIDLRHTV